MDVKIKNDDFDFKMRVCGCLIKDDKLLVVEMCDNGHYCLPGGHVHLGENSIDAIRREYKEEVLLDTQNKGLLCLNENFFRAKDGRKIHEVGYYYLLDGDISTVDFIRTENDEGELKKLDFRWVKLDDLDKIDFRPSILVPQLKARDYSFKHIVFDQTK